MRRIDQRYRLEQSSIKNGTNSTVKIVGEKIQQSVVVESRTNRLYRMSQNDGNYLC